jgi:hypothetical protein
MDSASENIQWIVLVIVTFSIIIVLVKLDNPQRSGYQQVVIKPIQKREHSRKKNVEVEKKLPQLQLEQEEIPPEELPEIIFTALIPPKKKVLLPPIEKTYYHNPDYMPGKEKQKNYVHTYIKSHGHHISYVVVPKKFGASRINFPATLSNCGKLLRALRYQTLLVIESVAELITLGMVKSKEMACITSRLWIIRNQTPNKILYFEGAQFND